MLVNVEHKIDLYDLFDKEKQNMINQYMEKYKEHFYTDFNDANFKFYIFQEKAFQNLNIIYNFHLDNTKLLERFERYPTLVRNSYINYISPYNTNSILEITEMKMSTCPLDQSLLTSI